MMHGMPQAVKRMLNLWLRLWYEGPETFLPPARYLGPMEPAPGRGSVELERAMFERLVVRGGEEASRGAYWCATSGEFVRVGSGGGVLPGAASDVYVRVFAPFMLFLTPVLGMFFVVFLPLALPVVALKAVAGQGRRLLARRTPTGAGSP
jgi:hypothetical protein